MEKLIDFDFTWVPPGHGERFRAESPAAMRKELERCVAWIRAVRYFFVAVGGVGVGVFT